MRSGIDHWLWQGEMIGGWMSGWYGGEMGSTAGCAFRGDTSGSECRQFFKEFCCKRSSEMGQVTGVQR